MRTIISLMTSWMFVVMGITGVVLYIVPQGRIAYWVDWRFLGLSKTSWGNLHIVASILFVVAGIWHLYFNWKPFVGHLRRRMDAGRQIRKELYWTLGATLLIALSALLRLPPLSLLLDANDAIKEAWISGPADEPPFGHAELLSLDGFCEKTRIDVDKASGLLKENGISFTSKAQTLAEIGKTNGISPKEVYEVFYSLKPASSLQKHIQNNIVLTSDEILEQFERTGIGQKTVDAACRFAGADPAVCAARLEKQGIAFESDDTLKSVANRAQVKPIQILQMMLADDVNR